MVSYCSAIKYKLAQLSKSEYIKQLRQSIYLFHKRNMIQLWQVKDYEKCEGLWLGTLRNNPKKKKNFIKSNSTPKQLKFLGFM